MGIFVQTFALGQRSLAESIKTTKKKTWYSNPNGLVGKQPLLVDKSVY